MNELDHILEKAYSNIEQAESMLHQSLVITYEGKLYTGEVMDVSTTTSTFTVAIDIDNNTTSSRTLVTVPFAEVEEQVFNDKKKGNILQ